MHSPHSFALIVTLLGISSFTSASPARSTSSSSSSLASAAYDTTAHAGTHRDYHIPSDNNAIIFPNADFKAGCGFVVRGRTYDICPLASVNKVVKGRVDKDTFRGKGKAKAREEWKERSYRVTLDGAKGSGSESCPDGTWVCLTERDGSRTTTTPVARSLEEGSSAIYVQNFVRDEREFDLWLASEKTGVRMVMVCGEEEGLKYEDDLDGLHVLRWRTRHACPTGSYDRIIIEAEDDRAPGDEEDVESPEDLRDDSLPVGGASRRLIGVVVLLVGCVLIILSILISSPQARQYTLARLQSAGYAILPFLGNLKQLTKPVSKHFPQFRVGESRLVRWAQEDMTLDGDEDFMVNGSSAEHRWSDLDEFIPLKASPTNSVFGRGIGASPRVSARWNYSTYGSVPFEGLDVDESEVDMGPAPEGGVKRFIRTASETATMRVKGLFRR